VERPNGRAIDNRRPIKVLWNKAAFRCFFALLCEVLVSTYGYLIQSDHDIEQLSAGARDWSSSGQSSLLRGPYFIPGRHGTPRDQTNRSPSQIDFTVDRIRHAERSGCHTLLCASLLDSDYRPGSGRRPATTHRRRTQRPLPTRANPPFLASPSKACPQGR
jgi:hypothetical protein